MKISTKNDIKQLAVTIESLAKLVQNKIDSGDDVLSSANELVRNNLTLVFALGEVSAAEQLASGKTVKIIKNSSNSKSHNYQNYYRVRDNNTGRFVSKS